MPRTVFMGIVFIFTSLSASAQTYLLNPYRQNPLSGPAYSPLAAAEEAAWLTAFYRKLPLLSSIDSREIKTANGLSLSEGLKEASRHFLELHLEEARDLLEDCRRSLIQSPPYAGMLQDAEEILALEWMISESLGGDALPTPEIKAMSESESFQNRLPLKSLTKLKASLNVSSEIHLKDLPAGSTRFLIYGKEKNLPVRLMEGRYLIHVLRENDLETYWMNSDSKAGFRFEKIESRSIWNSIPHKTLKETLESTRPKNVLPAGISVLVKNSNGRLSPVLFSALPAHPKAIPSPSSLSTAPADPFEKYDVRFEEADEAPSFFDSPWFWTVTGLVVAGAGAYFIYDAAHQSPSVRTP